MPSKNKEARNAYNRARYANDDAHREHVLAYRGAKKREYRADGRGYGSYIKAQYGITFEQYEQMWQAQRGCCGICEREMRRTYQDLIPGRPQGSATANDVAVIDHCHETSRIRGLLCSQCNRWIAMVERNPRRLRRAVAWLGFSMNIEREK